MASSVGRDLTRPRRARQRSQRLRIGRADKDAMSEASPRKKTPLSRVRRATRIALFLGAGAGALGIAAVVHAGPRRVGRGVFFAARIELGKSKDLRSDLKLLGRTRVPWAQRILEGHVHSD